MFRALPRPSSGAYMCISSLWLYRWRVAVTAVLFVVCQTTTNSTAITDQQHRYHHAPTVKLEAATAVVELLMMGVRTLETC